MAKNNKKEESIERKLWKSADKLRKNIDAAEYKHIVLGLIFLKYISDSFEELYSKLSSGEGDFAGADPEDKDEYLAENVFFVPIIARWSFLRSKAKLPDIESVLITLWMLLKRKTFHLRECYPRILLKKT